jgi:hypothetical protein
VEFPQLPPENQHSPGQTDSPKKETEQSTTICNLAHRGRGRTLKVHWRKGEEQGANLCRSIKKQMPEKQGQQLVGDKPLPEAGQVADHKNHLLNK